MADSASYRGGGCYLRIAVFVSSFLGEAHLQVHALLDRLLLMPFRDSIDDGCRSHGLFANFKLAHIRA